MRSPRGIMHSHEFFDEPMAFKPERYLKDGQPRPKALLDPDQVAFGFGRRYEPVSYTRATVVDWKATGYVREDTSATKLSLSSLHQC